MDLDIYTYVTIGAVVVLAACLVGLRSRAAKWNALDESQAKKRREGQQVEVEFAAAAEAAMTDLKISIEGLAACLANMELRMRTVDERQRKFDDMASKIARRRGFDEALHMVRDGKPASEVARTCALPLAEAELLSRIHQGTASH
ncbi:MAG: DUF2802 domain-containing protein [Oceanococcus sp.]